MWQGSAPCRSSKDNGYLWQWDRKFLVPLPCPAGRAGCSNGFCLCKICSLSELWPMVIGTLVDMASNSSLVVPVWPPLFWLAFCGWHFRAVCIFLHVSTRPADLRCQFYACCFWMSLLVTPCECCKHIAIVDDKASSEGKLTHRQMVLLPTGRGFADLSTHSVTVLTSFQLHHASRMFDRIAQHSTAWWSIWQEAYHRLSKCIATSVYIYQTV